MKRKYYLRGLGIGLIVGALLTGFFASGDNTLSDDEIISRAKQLGMIEGSVLTEEEESNTQTTLTDEGAGDISDIETASVDSSEIDQDNSSDTVIEADNEGAFGTVIDAASASESVTINGQTAEVIDATEGESVATAVSDEQTTTTDDEATSAKTLSSASVEASNTADEDGEAYATASRTIQIPGGTSSDGVAVLLAEAGIVDSSVTFNRYLIDRGLDRYIRSGTFYFPAGSTYEDIASILTGR